MDQKDNKMHYLKKPGLFLLCLLITGAAGYAGMSRYYADADFICGTWINGVYCAGSSVEEVNEQLLSEGVLETVVLLDETGNSYSLDVAGLLSPAAAAGREEKQDGGRYGYRYEEKLRLISQSQTPENWLADSFQEKRYTVEPEVELPEDAARTLRQTVRAALAERGLIEKTGNPAVLLHKTESEGYELIDTKKGHLNAERVADAVYAALQERRSAVDLAAEGCYEDLPYTQADRETLELWKKVEKFQDCKIVYRFGDSLEPVDASVVSGWIMEDGEGGFAFDQDGNLVLNEEKIKEYIDGLAEKYDTYGAAREFHATRGDTVTIEGGTYGNKLDKKAEVKYLKEAFLSGAEEVHEPAYEHKAWAQGGDDIGSTYIEVDMGEQKMYYYVGGECVLDTPIVTGNMMRKRDTPAAVCYVYGKQKNRILRGPGYASHVNFWMPVKGGIGIHDAKWRKNFGGEIYKTQGSHGCINTPYDAMEKLYDMADVGTPVVMFY